MKHKNQSKPNIECRFINKININPLHSLNVAQKYVRIVNSINLDHAL